MTTFYVPFTKKRKLAVLKEARRLIARPKGWAKGVWWDDVEGKDYQALCLGAACQRAAQNLGFADGDIRTTDVAMRVSLSRLLKKKTGNSYIPTFNDARGTRKKDVLALIDEKIAELSS